MGKTQQTISTLFFDLDGTLTDPMEGITRCYQYSLEQLGYPVPPQTDLVRYIGPPLRWTLPRLLGTGDEALVDTGVRHYRVRFADVGLFENELYEGVPELLSTSSEAGFRLYVVTTKPAVFAKRIVSHFDLDKYFVEIYGPELDGRFDDKTNLIEHILRERDLLPEETVMIGDRASDIEAGKANGTRTLAVTYGFGDMEELAAAEPDRICASPAEIEGIVTNQLWSAADSRS
jgi:phosphoglycolate phosphatase